MTWNFLIDSVRHQLKNWSQIIFVLKFNLVHLIYLFIYYMIVHKVHNEIQKEKQRTGDIFADVLYKLTLYLLTWDHEFAWSVLKTVLSLLCHWVAYWQTDKLLSVFIALHADVRHPRAPCKCHWWTDWLIDNKMRSSAAMR